MYQSLSHEDDAVFEGMNGCAIITDLLAKRLSTGVFEN